MHRYVIKRLILLIPTLLAVVFIVFTIMALTPGSPGRLLLGPMAPQESVDMLNDSLGYNRPFAVRFADYVGGIVTGDFGKSYSTGQPVFKEIFARFPTTLIIALIGVVGSAVIGIPLGVLSAVKQYSIIDGFTTAIALLLAAIPGFWLGLMVMLLFSLYLGWLPATGVATWRHFILPAITISLPGAAWELRMTRTTMLETIRQDYIRTARAKGASEKRVIWGHSLKNAMLPVITSMGMGFGSMLGGTILIESVFAMPGLGTLVVNGIRSKDIPIVMSSVVFLAAMFCLIMLAVDLIYAFIDPRIKARYIRRN